MTKIQVERERLTARINRVNDALAQHGQVSAQVLRALPEISTEDGGAYMDAHRTRGFLDDRDRIVKAATLLYDNRLGWSEGRNPYAPRELWDELGRALDRDPAGFCDPPATCRNCNVTVPRVSEMYRTIDGDVVCEDCADALGEDDDD